MLAERLVQRGHEVTVVTAVPHYPTGKVPSSYRKILVKRTRENGVNVIRVGLPSINRASLIQRFFQFLVYQLGAVLVALPLNPEIVLAGTPALEIWLPFTLFAWLRRKPAIYSVYDLYPDVGIRLGIFRNPAVIRIVTWLERSCVKGARKVHILSESFIPGMKRLGATSEKMRLISVWIDTDFINPLPRNNAFSSEQKLDKQFVVLYGGNLGPTHGLESIIDAAFLLRDRPNIKFVFVGDGIGKAKAQARAATLALSNVLFLPYQPRARLAEVLASSDVSLVTLQKGFGNDSLPSKTFSIFASARPLIACVDPDSPTWNLVLRSEAGLCVPPEDAPALARAILQLQENPGLCRALAERGRAYVQAHHSPDIATLAFEKLFEDALGLSPAIS
jgi:colanic acid biosynthesis glycosyl transferase WcaI